MSQMTSGLTREAHAMHWASEEDMEKYDKIFQNLPGSLDELAEGIKIVVDARMTTWVYLEGRHQHEGRVSEFLATRIVTKKVDDWEHTYHEFLRFSNMRPYWTFSPYIVSARYYSVNLQDSENINVNPEIYGDKDFCLKVYPLSRG